MRIRRERIAPDFEQDTTLGPIRFHEWLGSDWALLIGGRGRETPASRKDLKELASRRGEWERRGVKPIGLSTGLPEADPQPVTGARERRGERIYPPMVADRDARLALLYGAICSEDGAATGAQFALLIDPQKEIRLVRCYSPGSAAQTFSEILQTVDKLQLADAFDPVI